MADPFIITMFGLVLVGTVLLYVLVAPSFRRHDEAGVHVIYEDRCYGVRKFGFLFWASGISRWRISFYADHFVVAFLSATKIPYEKVLYAELKGRFFWRRLYVKTVEPRFEFILFPSQPDKMLEVLERNGVSIHGRRP